MRYGTQVAQELGLVFTMYVPVGYVLRSHSSFAPGINARNIRKPAAGNSAAICCMRPFSLRSTPAEPFGITCRTGFGSRKRGVRNTPRNIWRAYKNGFSGNRRILQAELGGTFNVASYPFGDIGQEECHQCKEPRANRAGLLGGKIMRPPYPDRFGYAVAGINRCSISVSTR
jgi:hypothetical protein